jgi:hypothetical protein
LEKWLPDPTTSGAKVTVSNRVLRSEWKNLDFDDKKFRKREDYPNEKVAEVTADIIRKWKVRVKKE